MIPSFFFGNCLRLFSACSFSKVILKKELTTETINIKDLTWKWSNYPLITQILKSILNTYKFFALLPLRGHYMDYFQTMYFWYTLYVCKYLCFQRRYTWETKQCSFICNSYRETIGYDYANKLSRPSRIYNSTIVGMVHHPPEQTIAESNNNMIGYLTSSLDGFLIDRL